MKVRECMSTDVVVASPKQTIAEAAGMMSECDSGILPVGENDRLVGMVTDRDIVIRAVAKNLGPTTPIRDVMSNDQVLYCFEDDDVADVAENLADQSTAKSAWSESSRSAISRSPRSGKPARRWPGSRAPGENTTRHSTDKRAAK